MNPPTKIIEPPKQWKPQAAFIAPFAAYMLVSSLVIAIWERVDIQLITDQSPAASLAMVIIRLASILVLFAWGFTYIKKSFPFRISAIAFSTGVFGAVLWIGLCRLNLESGILSILNLSSDSLGTREAVNPWELFGSDSTLHLFLILRFTLLVAAVPIAEELFLRGFLLRYLRDTEWTNLPLESLMGSAIGITAIYGIVSHPTEWIAAAIWFSMISVLMLRTKNFWDCVIAHSITNALLGAYIVWFEDWRLW